MKKGKNKGGKNKWEWYYIFLRLGCLW
jgi:hypothetical protein